MKTKPKKIRAQRRLVYSASRPGGYFVNELPADKESVEAMVEQGAEAMLALGCEYGLESFQHWQLARAVISSLGLTANR